MNQKENLRLLIMAVALVASGIAMLSPLPKTINCVTPAVACVPTPPPLQCPLDLTATAVSSAQINLSWTDNNYYESGFKVYRKTDENEEGTLIATVPANTTTFQDTTGLNPSTLYFYNVSAYCGEDQVFYPFYHWATTYSGSGIIDCP